MVVDISPVNVSPGAQAMTQFLTVMEDIDLGDQLKRATARKIVDEKLQVVVKVRTLQFVYFLWFYLNNFTFSFYRKRTVYYDNFF